MTYIIKKPDEMSKYKNEKRKAKCLSIVNKHRINKFVNWFDL